MEFWDNLERALKQAAIEASLTDDEREWVRDVAVRLAEEEAAQ